MGEVGGDETDGAAETRLGDGCCSTARGGCIAGGVDRVAETRQVLKVADADGGEYDEGCTCKKLTSTLVLFIRTLNDQACSWLRIDGNGKTWLQ